MAIIKFLYNDILNMCFELGNDPFLYINNA